MGAVIWAALRTVPAKIWAVLAAVGTAIALVMRAIARGRREAAAKVIAEHRERVLKQVEVRDEIANEVARLPAGGAADRLRREWSRSH